MSQGLRLSRLRYWLALSQVPGIGRLAQPVLLERGLEPETLFATSATGLAALGFGADSCAAFANPDWAQVDRELVWLERAGHCLVTITDPGYPTLLRQISDPPSSLFVAGAVEVLAQTQLAMVGARKATPAALEHAHRFARTLAQTGWVITSGLALGIDAAAHRGALTGGGRTIGVMATGPDRLYPARHRQLAEQIRDSGGALVTEFPLGMGVRREAFPQRNRIISGMSVGVVVVEAAERSGSLITARHAVEQGREVFAVPGSINNPLARGCHRLIRDGAKLVANCDDIVEQIAHEVASLTLAGALPDEQRTNLDRVVDRPVVPGVDLWVERQLDRDSDRAADAEELTGDYRNLLRCMGHDPAPVDILVQRTRLTAKEVSSMLLRLELKGLITSQPGGLYCRTA